MNRRGKGISDFLATLLIPTALCSLLASPLIAHKAAAAPQKQIFEVSNNLTHSSILSADGVAAYVVSTMGTNRGFLVKGLSGGLGSSMGLSPGDVVMSFDNHIVQDGRDIDRVLGGLPSGNVKVMFVHPSDSGLQLYNGPFRYTNLRGGTGGVVASASSSSSSRSGSQSASNSSEIQVLPSMESYVIELVNKDRSANGGGGSLHANAALTGIAREHAKDMLKRGFFAHVNPDGIDPQGRAKNAGIACGVYENIAYQRSSNGPSVMAAQCERDFMNEPPNQQNHRGNILNPAHVCVGVGVAMQGNKLMLVQEFADKDP